MKKQIFIGSDNFEDIIKNNCLYVDKTDFISSLFENREIPKKIKSKE